MSKYIRDILYSIELQSRCLPEKQYRAIPALSPSILSHGLRGSLLDPYAVKHAYESQSDEPTDAMIKGTLAHMACFEPQRLATEVAIWDGGTRRGKEWDAFRAAHNNKSIIRQGDYETVFNGIEIARQSLSELFAGCQVEKALTWNEGPIAMKGRPDAVRIGKIAGEQIVHLYDLKTTEAGIDDRSTDRITIDQHYREKLALYRRGHSKVHELDKSSYRVFLVFVQLAAPYGINVKQIDPTALDLLEEKMLALVGDVREGIERGFSTIVTQSSIGLMPWEEEEVHVE